MSFEEVVNLKIKADGAVELTEESKKALQNYKSISEIANKASMQVGKSVEGAIKSTALLGESLKQALDFYQKLLELDFTKINPVQDQINKFSELYAKFEQARHGIGTIGQYQGQQELNSITGGGTAAQTGRDAIDSVQTRARLAALGIQTTTDPLRNQINLIEAATKDYLANPAMGRETINGKYGGLVGLDQVRQYAQFTPAQRKAYERSLYDHAKAIDAQSGTGNSKLFQANQINISKEFAQATGTITKGFIAAANASNQIKHNLQAAALETKISHAIAKNPDKAKTILEGANYAGYAIPALSLLGVGKAFGVDKGIAKTAGYLAKGYKFVESGTDHLIGKAERGIGNLGSKILKFGKSAKAEAVAVEDAVAASRVGKVAIAGAEAGFGSIERARGGSLKTLIGQAFFTFLAAAIAEYIATQKGKDNVLGMSADHNKPQMQIPNAHHGGDSQSGHARRMKITHSYDGVKGHTKPTNEHTFPRQMMSSK